MINFRHEPWRALSDAHQGPAIAYKSGIEVGRVPYHLLERLFPDLAAKMAKNSGRVSLTEAKFRRVCARIDALLCQ